MKKLSTQYRELATAFAKQESDLLEIFVELADRNGSKCEATNKYFYSIGAWHRIKTLDRLSETNFLTDFESALLFEDGKRGDPRRGDPDLSEQRIQQIQLWEGASVRHRLLGFGLAVLIRPLYGAGNADERVFLFRMAAEALAYLDVPDAEETERTRRIENARRNANLRHDKPNGSRAKRVQIIAIWASGKHSSRDLCAEEECAALGMSFATARKALRGLPDPHLANAK